jgi:hypothetical protein
MNLFNLSAKNVFTRDDRRENNQAEKNIQKVINNPRIEFPFI